MNLNPVHLHAARKSSGEDGLPSLLERLLEPDTIRSRLLFV
jgi:hypothetical protein